MAEPIIEAEDISLIRNGHTLLTDISLSVEPEARLLIQGPSGAGKTSLFRILGLLEPPSSGRLVIAGKDVSGLSERSKARLRRDTIGIVFQNFQLVPDLSAWENAALPQDHTGSRDEDWLNTLFERLEILDLKEQFPATLSGGEKQRVAIARALANKPAYVLADEPTGQLDPDTASQVLDLLLSMQQDSDTALIVVSHDRTIANHFDTFRYLNNDGRLESAE